MSSVPSLTSAARPAARTSAPVPGNAFARRVRTGRSLAARAV